MVDSWEQFKKIHGQFALGHLDTETPNPMTKGLSQAITQDAVKGMELLRAVDLKMLEALGQWHAQVSELGREVENTLKSGGRIFLSGCGATGRLSLSLEALWRFERKTEQVVGFMAGGDTALIRAIERFEDYPELGARQLHELGFTKSDLLIASTEGGETPFVIGSAMAAAEMGANVWFNFCNPADQLKHLERCQLVLNDSRVKKLSLALGPQALSGSTRMQASSALMLVAGLALWFGAKAGEQLTQWTKDLGEDLKRINLNEWSELATREAEIIARNECVTYVTPANYSICILTDTTERGPTFSMIPFEHNEDPNDRPALNYMVVDGATSASDAFVKILGHAPRTLDWPELGGRADEARLNGFILTRSHLNERAITSHLMQLQVSETGLALEFAGQFAHAQTSNSDLFYRHLILKMLLNTHSTLLMGLLGRYKSNVMTWVRASNFKLIDRTLRYASLLLKEEGIKVDQNSLGLKLFELIPSANLDQPLVLTLAKHFAQMSEDVK